MYKVLATMSKQIWFVLIFAAVFFCHTPITLYCSVGSIKCYLYGENNEFIASSLKKMCWLKYQKGLFIAGNT